MACFTNMYEAVEFAEIYTRNNNKPAFVCNLQIVYATAGGAR